MIFWGAAVLGVYLSALSGVDSPQRATAIDSLAASGDVAAVAGAMRGTNWRVRAGLFDALERMGAVAVDGSPPTPHLARLGADDQRPPTLRVIVDSLVSIAEHHPKVDAQRLAIRSLGRVGGNAARDYLLTLGASPHRDLVAQALGEIGDSTAVPLLRHLLKDKHPDVRRRAALALGRVMGDRAVDDLVGLLDDGHHGVRFAVVERLAEMGDRAGAVALVRWETFRLSGKISAMRLWTRLRFAPALPILERLLRDPEWSLRASAVAALGALGDSQVRLEEALAHERHPYVQARLKAAIDVLHSPSSVDESP